VAQEHERLRVAVQSFASDEGEGQQALRQEQRVVGRRGDAVGAAIEDRLAPFELARVARVARSWSGSSSASRRRWCGRSPSCSSP
jgi:hypothetical protein